MLFGRKRFQRDFFLRAFVRLERMSPADRDGASRKTGLDRLPVAMAIDTGTLIGL